MNSSLINKSNFQFNQENFNWNHEIKNYEESKKTLPWKENKLQSRVTHKEIKQNDSFFNPITQKYNNKDYETNVKSIEKTVLPMKIANFQDRNLRYEQTFDIITLKDKLSMFVDHPDYPRQKEKQGKVVIDNSKINYNIISNRKLLEHHYDKPENRPVKPSSSPILKKQVKQAWSFKDYDIINNMYIENNNIKKEVDEKVFKLESASKYWKTHDYNIVTGEYYNQKKEEIYKNDKKEKDKAWGKDFVKKLPKKIQEQGMLYNPVNQEVLDSERLKIYEQKERNKKKKYEKRGDIEKYYYMKSQMDENRKENQSMNKKSYEEYKEIDNRGYDIISFKKNYHTYKENKDFKNHNKPWEVLKQKANQGNALVDEKIYKDKFDFSDVDTNKHKFKIVREKELKGLCDIKDDCLFGERKNKNMVQIHDKNEKEKINIVRNDLFNVKIEKIDKKEEFFSKKQ